MPRPRLAAFCVLLMMMFDGSGVVWGQEIRDAYAKFFQGYHDEFFSSPELFQKHFEFMQFTNQLMIESVPTQGESVLDREYALHKKIAEKEKEMFPDAQERQLRRFQIRESIMSRLEVFNDPDDFLMLDMLVGGRMGGGSHFGLGSSVPPDFLELTPEQTDLIKKIQMETELKSNLLRQKAYEQSEKLNELVQLGQKIQESFGKLTLEEHTEIANKLNKVSADIIKPCVPELKAILIEGRESYMRVLTDAQKAKIEAVMADMPDYMKNLFAAIDREGGGLSILHNWQPGMGVPGVNPNREAPRERSSTGGRAFSGN